MSERYAELCLYFGLCDSESSGEGRFYEEDEDAQSSEIDKEYFIERRMRALYIINKYLEPGWRQDFVRYGTSYNPKTIAESEEEARLLIGFAEKNIPGAQGIIEPIDSMHGTIRFFRKIRFKGYTKERESELIESLKKSSYVPKNQEAEGMKRRLGDLYESEELDERIKEGFPDPDKPWKDALVFC